MTDNKCSPDIYDARRDVAIWMMENSYVTGHGDTLDDLLKELVTQAQQAVAGVAQASVDSEDRTIFVLQEIARGRCDNGRPLGGETARQMARMALDTWPGRASAMSSTNCGGGK